MSVLALSRGDAERLPSRRDEAWRYSDLRSALRVLPPPSTAIPAVPEGGPFGQLSATELRITNGRLERALETGRTGGFEIAAGAPQLRSTDGDLPRLAGRHANGPPLEIRLAAGRAEALRLRFISGGDGGSHHARVAISIGAGAELTLLESYEGLGSAYFSNTVLEFELEQDARLRRIVLLEEPDDAVSVSTAEVRLAPRAQFDQTVVATGARLQRHETHVHHPGEGARARLDGVYLLGGARHADLTTTLAHAGAGGETSQLTKGLAADRARGVFQGKIVVAEGADGTDARMRHAALLLSDRAEIDAKPELEIYADDVACAHGNAIGALDEDALFYVRSRGVPEPAARAMLIQAFLGEVVERIESQPVREVVRRWIERRLEALG